MSSPNRTPLADIINASAAMGAPLDPQELEEVAAAGWEAQIRMFLWLLNTPRVAQSQTHLIVDSPLMQELVRQEVAHQMAAHRCPSPQPAVRRVYQTLIGLPFNWWGALVGALVGVVLGVVANCYVNAVHTPFQPGYVFSSTVDELWFKVTTCTCLAIGVGLLLGVAVGLLLAKFRSEHDSSEEV